MGEREKREGRIKGDGSGKQIGRSSRENVYRERHERGSERGIERENRERNRGEKGGE